MTVIVGEISDHLSVKSFVHNSNDLLLKRLAIIFAIRILHKVEHISNVAAITVQTYGGSKGHRSKESKTKKNSKLIYSQRKLI